MKIINIKKNLVPKSHTKTLAKNNLIEQTTDIKSLVWEINGVKLALRLSAVSKIDSDYTRILHFNEKKHFIGICFNNNRLVQILDIYSLLVFEVNSALNNNNINTISNNIIENNNNINTISNNIILNNNNISTISNNIILNNNNISTISNNIIEIASGDLVVGILTNENFAIKTIQTSFAVNSNKLIKYKFIETVATLNNSEVFLINETMLFNKIRSLMN